MNYLGLALSGGGFRATLYHLGVIRMLRDAGILPKVTHITTVSGGSIIGAHLVLNWERYCGTEQEFQAASEELIKFVKLDIRNRIVRRFPFTSAVNLLRRTVRLGSDRRLTRPGLLEKHYEEFLYGQTSLFELPKYPQLHILSTNLSEGGLASFHRNGLLQQRRVRGQRDRFEKIHLGLATVPMAVAASSAFPGFFPPLQLSGWDVGADPAEFDRQAFTDGGIYDNLGLRMFRCIEQSWIRETAPLTKEDFLDFEATLNALETSHNLPENSPLHRLGKILSQKIKQPHESGNGQKLVLQGNSDAVIDGMWEVIKTEELYRDPSLQQSELSDPSAQSLLQYLIDSNHKPDISDQYWLNRHIIESTLRQAVGTTCLQTSRRTFDCIMVSDAGAMFKVNPQQTAGGLIRTSLRASDILMDRVWQLELETFTKSSNVLFFPITDIVEPSQDTFAPHPEIQRQAARIRTDLDAFSDLEISALVQHGYCVARKRCTSHNEFFNNVIPSGKPWDPFQSPEKTTTADTQQPSESNVSTQTESDSVETLSSTSEPDRNLSEITEARKRASSLRYSSSRRIWSTLFDIRDWPTYIWIPLTLIIVFTIPYLISELNERTRQQQIVLSAMSQSSPVYRKVLSLLEEGPIDDIPLMPFEEVDSLEQLDFTGFEIVTDVRVFDLRPWADPEYNLPGPTSHSIIRIRRTQDGEHNTHLRFQLKSVDEASYFFVHNKSLSPTMRRMKLDDNLFRWELDLNLSHIPLGGSVEVVTDSVLASDMTYERSDESRFNFTVPAETGFQQIWMILPEHRVYDNFELSRFPIDQPDDFKIVEPSSKVEIPLGAIATFQMINPQENYRYECQLNWIDLNTPSP